MAGQCPILIWNTWFSVQWTLLLRDIWVPTYRYTREIPRTESSDTGHIENLAQLSLLTRVEVTVGIAVGLSCRLIHQTLISIITCVAFTGICGEHNDAHMLLDNQPTHVMWMWLWVLHIFQSLHEDIYLSTQERVPGQGARTQVTLLISHRSVASQGSRSQLGLQ